MIATHIPEPVGQHIAELRRFSEVPFELFCAPFCANRCRAGLITDVFADLAGRGLVSN